MTIKKGESCKDKELKGILRGCITRIMHDKKTTVEENRTGKKRRRIKKKWPKNGEAR